MAILRVMPLLSLGLLMLGKTDRIDEWVKTRMERDHIAGMAVGVYRNGHPIKVKAYGKIDLEHDVPTRKDSPFEICSITKQFTAGAILLLAEEGKLSLDDPLSKFFPDADPSWKEVRLADVLHHTTGLASPLDEGDFEKPWDEVLKAYLKQKPAAPPRTRWAYNNTAYSLLGDVVQKVSGEPIWTYMKRRIFDPLHMDHTFPNSPAMQKGRVRGYVWDGKAYINQEPLDKGLATGDLVSTPDDLMRWSEALRKGTLLKPARRAAMLLPARLDSGEEAITELAGGYGFGVFLIQMDGRMVEAHSGGWASASAQLTRIPDAGLTIVVLTNAGGLDERPWWGEQIGEILTGHRYVPAFEVAPDPDLARTTNARTIFDKAQMEEDPKGPKTRSFEFVRAVPQGKATVLLYRVGLEKPYLVTFTEQEGKLTLSSAFPVPMSELATK
ncbi:hypothetical protein BH11ARM2_BH11ARM2_29480 [soil metagenome]